MSDEKVARRELGPSDWGLYVKVFPVMPRPSVIGVEATSTNKLGASAIPLVPEFRVRVCTARL